MGYTYYKLMALIPKDAEITFDDIYARLQRKFAKIEEARIERPETNHIQLRFNDWLYHIHLEDKPSAIELIEILETFATKRPDWDVIASSDQRMTTYGMSDPDMDHFNDHVFVMEVLESLPELYLYDPNDGKLWKSGENPFAN